MTSLGFQVAAKTCTEGAAIRTRKTMPTGNALVRHCAKR